MLSLGSPAFSPVKYAEYTNGGFADPMAQPAKPASGTPAMAQPQGPAANALSDSSNAAYKAGASLGTGSNAGPTGMGAIAPFQNYSMALPYGGYVPPPGQSAPAGMQAATQAPGMLTSQQQGYVYGPNQNPFPYGGPLGPSGGVGPGQSAPINAGGSWVGGGGGTPDPHAAALPGLLWNALSGGGGNQGNYGFTPTSANNAQSGLGASGNMNGLMQLINALYGMQHNQSQDQSQAQSTPAYNQANSATSFDPYSALLYPKFY